MSREYQRIIDTVKVLSTGLYQQNSDFNNFYDDISDYKANGINPSEALFYCDNDAYKSQLNEWKEQDFECQFEATLQLLEDEHIRLRVKPLTQALKKDKIVPFIGAGLSIPCGKKSWADMLLDIGERSSRLDQVKFKKIIKKGDYVQAADEIVSCSSEQLSEYIKTSLASSKPVGPVSHLPEITSECIITSNLDDILEQVFQEKNQPFTDGYMYGVQDNNFFHHLVSGGKCLLKLHGDYRNPNTQVFTGEQYNQAYGVEGIDFSNILPKALRQIFISKSLLFLGCSLLKDRTLDLFESVIRSNQFHIPDHYALLEAPEDEDTREREHELARLRIKPIWYPHGKHEHVENFIQFLAAHKKDEAPSL